MSLIAKYLSGMGSPKRILYQYMGGRFEYNKCRSCTKKNLYDAVFMARFHPQKGPDGRCKSMGRVDKDLPEGATGNDWQRFRRKRSSFLYQKKGFK